MVTTLDLCVCVSGKREKKRKKRGLDALWEYNGLPLDRQRYSIRVPALQRLSALHPLIPVDKF